MTKRQVTTLPLHEDYGLRTCPARPVGESQLLLAGRGRAAHRTRALGPDYNRSGFTLIELLIVVAIIGILAAIAVPNFLNAQSRSKIARNNADMRSLATAVETLRLESGHLPVDHWDDDTQKGCELLQEYFNKVGMGPDCEQRSTWAVLAVLTSPIAYMASLPQDPFFVGLSGESTTYRYGDYEAAYVGESGTNEYNHNFNALKPEYAKNLNLRPLALNEFALIGSGPDKEFGIGAGAGDRLRAVPYDATNGLTSIGDIVFRSGGN